MVEELIIKLFCTDKSYYDKYYKHINLNYIKINFVNIYKLFLVVANFYEKNNNKSISQSDLEIAYHSSYLLEDSERDELSSTLTRILEQDVNVDNVTNYLNAHRKRCLAGELAKVALDVEDGSANMEDLMHKVNQMEHEEVSDVEATAVNMDLLDLQD